MTDGNGSHPSPSLSLASVLLVLYYRTSLLVHHNTTMASTVSTTTTTTEQQPLTADTWWDIVIGRKDGVTPLFQRCQRLLGWDDATAISVSVAYREFLECKAFVRDWDDTKLAPSVAINQMWREHLMDNARYADDCQLLFGRRVIHYNPDRDDVDAPARRVRIERTKALIAARHGGEEILASRAWNFCAADAVTIGAVTPDSAATRRRAASPLPLAMDRNVRNRHNEQPQPPPYNVLGVVGNDNDDDDHDEDSMMINIAVRDAASLAVTCFRIHKTARMLELFQLYTESRGYPASTWQDNYRFCSSSNGNGNTTSGEPIHPALTLVSLGLIHDHDEIEADFVHA
jgi:hypothetical protein